MYIIENRSLKMLYVNLLKKSLIRGIDFCDFFSIFAMRDILE